MKSQLTKYHVPAAFLVTILLAGVAPAIATAAPTITHYRSKGLTAHLDFYTLSSFAETAVSIDATEGLLKSPSSLFVYVSQYDFTSGIYTSYCGGLPLTSSQIQFTEVGNTLQSASLNFTGAVLQDCSGTTSATATVDVSVTWTGSGSTYRNRDNFSAWYGPETFHGHSAGIERFASAVGSVIVNGTDVLAAVAADSEFAYLMKSTQVSVDIMKVF